MPKLVAKSAKLVGFEVFTFGACYVIILGGSKIGVGAIALKVKKPHGGEDAHKVEFER
jgi:hypothetical protein